MGRSWFRAAVPLLALVGACGGGGGATSATADAQGPDGGMKDGLPVDAPAHACHPAPSAPSGWQPAQPAGPNALSRVFVSPGGTTVFAMDDSAKRLFRSEDDGQTWCYLETPAGVYEVFFSGDPQRTLYLTAPADAAADGSTPPPSRIYRSDDGGDTWGDPGGTLPGRYPQLFPASDKPGEMFAAMTPGGVWATRDGGAHWEQSTAGEGARWEWIARHPVRKQEIYGLVSDANVVGLPPYFLWMSSDEGRTWSQVKAAAGTAVLSPRFEPDGSLLAMAAGQLHVLGVDGTWKTRGQPVPPGARFILGESTRPAALYVGTGASGDPIRAWKSADDGNTWSLVYSHVPVGVAVWPMASGQLLERGPLGLRASGDDGQTWRTVHSFVQGPSLTRTAAGAGAIFLYGSQVLSRSDDQGASWTTVPFFADRRIVRLIPDPTAPDTHFAILAPRNAISPGRLARSRDGGKTWTDLPGAGSVLDFAVLPTSPPTLLAASMFGVIRSEDDGATWAPTMGAKDSVFVPNLTVQIRPAPSKPAHVYGLFNSRLYQSTDAGRSWVVLLLPDQGIGAIQAVDPTDENTVYFSNATGPGLFKYSGTVRPLPMSVRGIALTSARPGVLYFIDQSGRLGRTSDEGQTITLLDLPAPVRTPLMFDPRQPDLLYAVAGELVKKVVE